MGNFKGKQLESEIHFKISEIIHNLDYEFSDLITITEVILNRDNSIAKIYSNFLSGDKDKQLNNLKNLVPRIKKELSKILKVKKIPHLEFLLDDNLDKIKKMEDLLEKVNKK